MKEFFKALFIVICILASIASLIGLGALFLGSSKSSYIAICTYGPKSVSHDIESGYVDGAKTHLKMKDGTTVELSNIPCVVISK